MNMNMYGNLRTVVSTFLRARKEIAHDSIKVTKSQQLAEFVLDMKLSQRFLRCSACEQSHMAHLD